LLTTTNTTLALNGSANFVQTGGTHKIANTLAIGFFSNATYSLTNGTLISGLTYAGRWSGGSGQYLQSGGSATLGEFLIGFESGTMGSARISGGTMNSTELVVGYGGNY